MDVNRATFPERLPTILRDISTAHFIALDLELSGIPVTRFRDVKQTLQERYTEVKQAAEQFHILQVGLTCGEKDHDIDGKYILRPYNFNLSPLIYDGLEIERSFTYSSGAVDFLLKHNYNMNSPFDAGIPYLSKSETVLAKERAILRWDKAAIPDIKIRPDDTEALNFVKRVHKEVDKWERTHEPEHDFFNVKGTPRPTSDDPEAIDPLSRFEKRLIHQIIRSDYPRLQTYSRPEYVQVQHRNAKEQASESEALQRRLTQAIFGQVGFRWITEAMAGGDLSGVEASLLAKRVDGERIYPDLKSFTSRLDEIKDSLKSRRPTLVGHNCFLDLVFLYKHFYGDLPATVTEFKQVIHEIFPLIIDTKYVATAGPEGAKYRSSQLWQIDESLTNQAVPTIETAMTHSSYTDAQQYHEAGFDSFVTAKVFLRLAALLRGGADAVEAKPLPPSLPAVEESHPPVSTRVKKSAKKTVAQEQPASNNMFASLDGLPEDDDSADEGVPLPGGETEGLVENPVSSSSALKPGETAKDVARRLKTMELGAGPATVEGKGEGEGDASIPGWESVFWGKYGNRMRVYGTKEEVFALGGEVVGK